MSAAPSAAALFGDANKVKFVPLIAQQRFTALQSGEVDLLSRNTTWTLHARHRAAASNFTGVTYYDGQGFMVAKKLGVKSAKELNGATVCVQPGTTTELNLADYFRANKMSFKPVVIEKLEEISSRLLLRPLRCLHDRRLGPRRDARREAPPSRTTTSSCRRSSPRSRSGPPCAMATTSGPTSSAGRFYALVEAEEYGITAANVDEMQKSDNPGIKRMLGVTPGMGKALGVDEEWADNIIKAVGNYGEMYERNVGAGSALKLDRGLNALWTQGGHACTPRRSAEPDRSAVATDRSGRSVSAGSDRIFPGRSRRVTAWPAEPQASVPPVVRAVARSRIRGYVFQVVVFGAVVALGWFLVSNTLENLAARRTSPRASTSSPQAGFDIGDTLIAVFAGQHLRPARSGSAFSTPCAWRVIGIVLATVLGTIIGIGRLSTNWLLAKICGWLRRDHSATSRCCCSCSLVQADHASLAAARARPRPSWQRLPLQSRRLLSRAEGRSRPYVDGHRFAGRHRRRPSCWRAGRATARTPPASTFPSCWRRRPDRSACRSLVLLLGGAPLVWAVPALRGFNFVGGVVLLPEFFALLIGLTIYTAAFIAEIVRAGILAVNRGQTEAAPALGPDARAADAAGDPAAGVARHHPADDQPVPQHHQELARSPSPSAIPTSSPSITSP